MPWRQAGLISWPEAVLAAGFDSPVLRYSRFARLRAVLTSVLRAHADIFTSSRAAAASQSAFSSSVRRIWTTWLLRSSGGFSGAPRFGVVFIALL